MRHCRLSPPHLQLPISSSQSFRLQHVIPRQVSSLHVARASPRYIRLRISTFLYQISTSISISTNSSISSSSSSLRNRHRHRHCYCHLHQSVRGIALVSSGRQIVEIEIPSRRAATMPQYQASSEHVQGAKDAARDTAEDAKRFGQNTKESLRESWDSSKRWGQEQTSRAKANIDAGIENPKRNVIVDFGHPLINRVFDGFVKVGGVGVLHAASQDTYGFLLQEETTKKSLESSVQRLGKEAVQWGLVAGVYSGVTYGIQEARGVHDWKNALLGGVLTGAALSLTEANPGSDRVLRGAITGGAIATAAEVLRNIT
ncbi:hypothetical protein MPTK1_6g06100 [Marchantia polymorpha subsp. ruderalis]|uniref:Uncharacterized protein n=2 Tax=Marchantia polymorpha TaxID=3197 RepID=A0AAF6BP29_MARPO|nr:hypothetical protein MARPO_0097s0034 [Marchantia polymorpha]BBN13763.1 hypothetical protein Mp_6g06100 [Marchantia polymorpha subsp. ruderalis]|eukprot:PTQ32549.1 hypothetical protein MARPO_0097s0034 [Marchantia polymorpha]